MATKKTAKTAPKKAAASGLGAVTLDPNLPLLPGRTVTFIASPRTFGRAAVKIVTARDTWMGVPSISGGFARQAKIIETGLGEITVTFYEDGEAYAEGTFSV